MRSLHILVRLTLASVLTAAGVVLFMYSTSELYDLYQENLPKILHRELARQIAAGVFIGVTLISFAPLWPKRKKDPDISFSSTHSDVIIELEHAEKTLERVASRLPEVKRISLKLKPSEESGRIQILANSLLRKDADGDARLITARLGSYLKTHARKILGQDDVEVKLKVRWAIKMRSVKPEPLQLEGPADPAPVEEAPQAAGIQPAPVIESAQASVAAAVETDGSDLEPTSSSGYVSSAHESEAKAEVEDTEDSSAYEDLPSIELEEPSPAYSDDDDDEKPAADLGVSDDDGAEHATSEDDEGDEEPDEVARGW